MTRISGNQINTERDQNAIVFETLGTERARISVAGILDSNGLNIAGRVILASGTLSASATEIDITSIPAGYNALELWAYLRGTAAAAAVSARVQFNGDTAANYDVERFVADGSTVTGASAASATSLTIISAAGNTAPSNEFAPVVAQIPFYANTTGNKPCISQGGLRYAAAGLNLEQFFGAWVDTSAINRIRIFPSSGNWATGCRYVLYGG